MTCPRILSLFLMTAMALGPTTLYAQGYEFGSDDTSSTEADATAEQPSEGITFDESDTQTETTEEVEKIPVVAVIALPGENMSEGRMKEIKEEMDRLTKDISGNIYAEPAVNDAILAGLNDRGGYQCFVEDLCLGSVGAANGVDQILVAVASPSDEGGGETLRIDLFDVKEKLYIASKKSENLASSSEMIESVKPLVFGVFNVRERKKKNFAEEDASLVAPIIAYSSLILALGAAGAGGYFTYLAYKGDKELRQKVEDQTITQVKADKDNQSVKSNQSISYIFYGLAGGLAAVSIVFFTLDIGSDVDEDAEASVTQLKFSPTFSHDGAGLSAGFKF